MEALTVGQQATLTNASPEQRKQLAIQASQNLTAADKKEVAAQADFPQPSPDVANVIWVAVVFAFIVILIGAAIMLGVGHFVAGVQTGGTPTETVLLLFTTAAAFLTGLLVKSPVDNKTP